MRYRCNNPACGTFPRGFEFLDHDGECPKCGVSGPGSWTAPGIATLIDVHLMVLSAKGPIMGGMGRQYVACEPKRAYLCRHAGEMWAATGEASAVTCPKCLRTREYAEVATLAGLVMQPEPPAVPLTVDLGATVTENSKGG